MSEILTITNWLNAIGITVKPAEDLAINLLEYAILDDVWVYEGVLYINEQTHPGNLLHDAGHLATTPSILRSLLSGDLEIEPFDLEEVIEPYHQTFIQTSYEDPTYRAFIEMGEPAAIAWSFAACVHLQIDTRIPFQEEFFTDADNNSQALSLWESLRMSCGRAYSYYCGINSLFHSRMLRKYSDFPELEKWIQI